jgi:hypothetical protein
MKLIKTNKSRVYIKWIKHEASQLHVVWISEHCKQCDSFSVVKTPDDALMTEQIVYKSYVCTSPAYGLSPI